MNESKHAGLRRVSPSACWAADDGRLSRAGRPAARPQMDFFRRAARERGDSDSHQHRTTPLNERYSFQTFVIENRTSSRRPRTPSPKHRQDV